jgi:hypothetical protein
VGETDGSCHAETINHQQNVGELLIKGFINGISQTVLEPYTGNRIQGAMDLYTSNTRNHVPLYFSTSRCKL